MRGFLKKAFMVRIEQQEDQLPEQEIAPHLSSFITCQPLKETLFWAFELRWRHCDVVTAGNVVSIAANKDGPIKTTVIISFAQLRLHFINYVIDVITERYISSSVTVPKIY